MYFLIVILKSKVPNHANVLIVLKDLMFLMRLDVLQILLILFGLQVTECNYGAVTEVRIPI